MKYYKQYDFETIFKLALGGLQKSGMIQQHIHWLYSR